MDTGDKTVLVFDIGKTHVKVTLLDDNGVKCYQSRTSNTVKATKPYNSFDTDRIWDWLLAEIGGLTPTYTISAISIATHGAAAALIDAETDRLLLPIMDYEFDDYPDDIPDYAALRPPFDITGSPEFPGGLNLGRQLNWQCRLLSQDTLSRASLLMYPQYWAWRLTGKLSSEITSLGCHTDLWDVRKNTPSPLLKTLGLEHALPLVISAWEALGSVRPEIAAQTGLPAECSVYPGVHDSNAGFLPILGSAKKDRPTVVSSGTWTVIMDSQAGIEALDASKDMLVNIDAEGTPIATARYMGGREFGLVCERLNTDIATTFTDEDVNQIIDNGTLILPSFCSGTGPYPDASGEIVSGKDRFEINGKAAATIYSALMVDNILKQLNPDSTQDILLEGSFASNEVLCRLLAALNPNRNVRVQNQGNGVTHGCYLLTRRNMPAAKTRNPKIEPYVSAGFSEYAKQWNAAVDCI